jgi:DNA-binding NarL/FixJ family response regulator
VIKVLVVDDHAPVRRGLIEIMMRELKAVECGEAEEAEGALAEARRQAWDLVILDVNMPGRSGLEVLPELKRARPEVPVLVVSMELKTQYARQALKVGASGYVRKDSSPEEFIAAIRTVMAGGVYLSAATAGELAGTVSDALPTRLPTF